MIAVWENFLTKNSLTRVNSLDAISRKWIENRPCTLDSLCRNDVWCFCSLRLLWCIGVRFYVQEHYSIFGKLAWITLVLRASCKIACQYIKIRRGGKSEKIQCGISAYKNKINFNILHSPVIFLSSLGCDFCEECGVLVLYKYVLR